MNDEGASEKVEAGTELETARAELESSRREMQSTAARLDEIARAYASMVNDQQEFRGRLEREKQRVLEAEQGKVALALLEVGDELDRALTAAGSDGGPLAQGVRLINEGLRKRLTAMGIERLALVGQPFDPNLAEAVDLVPVADPALNDTVVAEALPGYRLGARVLRPARVRVARLVAETKSEEPASP